MAMRNATLGLCMTIRAQRLLHQPIIHQGMCASLGNNINGPSLIRVPDWVKKPLGKYYLYFAHHEGRSIRLAYANDLTGPWVIHKPGALCIEHSLFPSDPAQITPSADNSDSISSMGIVDYLPHIASPDVLVDHENQQILMYFHGMIEDGDQKTRVALSKDGLLFDPRPELFDHFYFRVFPYRGWHWAISWGGYLYRSRTAFGPFERGPAIFEHAPVSPPGRILRHLALIRLEDTLHLFFSRIGDCPEAIYHTAVALDDDWDNWRISNPQEILRPEEEWEGATLPMEQSSAGAAHTPEHALRDPCIFRDSDQKLYLLYCGGGEQAIGIAEVQGL